MFHQEASVEIIKLKYDYVVWNEMFNMYIKGIII